MMDSDNVLSDFEEKILLEMTLEGWYLHLTNLEKKDFYKEWWSKRLE